MRVTTQDLYCGAYILSKGGILESVKLEETGRDGRPSVTFILSGVNVGILSNEFQSGKASVNLASFKVAMNHLKDIMFQKLRSGGRN
jgi:hypothetical protein